MTLDEAIKHCEDVAEDRCGCAEDCVNEHRQLAEWLKELKAYREADAPRLEVTREEFEKIVEQIKDAPIKLERLTDCGWGKPE